MSDSEGYSHIEDLDFTPSIFDDMENEKIFFQSIRKYYRYFLHQMGYEPIISEDRLYDAWASYVRDKKHVRNSLPENNKPDHFKLSGILVYWLRRFAPVYDLRDLSNILEKNPALMKLAQKYPSEFPAFDFGVSACDFFISHNAGETSMGRPKVDIDYYEFICYIMKFKNLSPHSMGAIYKSLFMPLARNG